MKLFDQAMGSLWILAYLLAFTSSSPNIEHLNRGCSVFSIKSTMSPNKSNATIIYVLFSSSFGVYVRFCLPII